MKGLRGSGSMSSLFPDSGTKGRRSVFRRGSFILMQQDVLWQVRPDTVVNQLGLSHIYVHTFFQLLAQSVSLHRETSKRVVLSPKPLCPRVGCFAEHERINTANPLNGGRLRPTVTFDSSALLDLTSGSTVPAYDQRCSPSS